ncbi:lysophospholipid acyltransferase family protein [Pendulispora albinea]|uniref:1-acyl-sn-glycerol-3-phosphate acyltransferase n=1 Tax=Pendulispora albinea TaxID=2741071 RepID=A0ABZ2M018_9BACT
MMEDPVPSHEIAQPRGASRRTEPLDLLREGEGLLSPLERGQIRFIRKSLEPGNLDSSLRWLQRHIGANWIEASIRNLRHVYGTERMPRFDPAKSYVLVSNHRSFFDLYVVTGYLVKRGLPHRILFPVRSNFFYDHPFGPVVNGVMSFFAMYPPVFRDRKRQGLNLAGIDETASLLQRGGVFVGLHPEGARNRTDDPYTLLPAQSGVGRIIHRARATVIPVFVHGLGNAIVSQIASNATRTGRKVVVVFGRPLELDDLFKEAPSPRAFRRVSERARDAISALGEEERALRAQLEGSR